MAHLNVFVLTYCRREELLYGSELVFKTLREGFPNATVTVVDNASLPQVRERLKDRAKKEACRFEQLERPLAHDEFLSLTLHKVARESPTDPLVFIDPDICFWENCEDFEFNGLISGRFVSAHEFSPLECVTMPRLHSSFLWIHSPSKLLSRITDIGRKHFDFEPFKPVSIRLGDIWLRYDTGASLFAALPAEVSFFREEHLDRYDHLFCGTHPDVWQERFVGPLRELMQRTHRHAQEGNLSALRGIWREQDRIWAECFAVYDPEHSILSRAEGDDSDQDG